MVECPQLDAGLEGGYLSFRRREITTGLARYIIIIIINSKAA